jgi:A/G-specific adenine glycosylase
MDIKTQKLIKWYKKNHRKLPWREEKTCDPYKIWLAEVMSQQTQITTLLPYYYKFLEKFKTVEELASASLDDVLKLWSGLGYYSRAKRLHECAKLIAKNGFSKTYCDWLKLPGIGPYTAAAICSQAYNEPVPVFDGNVLRVFSRLTLEKNPWSKKFQNKCISFLKTKISRKNASYLNQALMELGSLVCTKENPKCEKCPIYENCLAYKKNCQTIYPPLKPAKKHILKVYSLVLLSENNFYLVKRRKGFWYSEFYDFASSLGGGKTPIVEEDLILKFIKKSKFLGEVNHSITNYKITIKVYFLKTDKKILEEFSKRFEVKKINFDNLLDFESTALPLSTIAKKIIKLLARKITKLS